MPNSSKSCLFLSHSSNSAGQRRANLLTLFSLSLALAACGAGDGKSGAPGAASSAAAAAAPRNVKVLQVGESSDSSAVVLAAEIRPRLEVRLAFRVPGRVRERLVEVGQTVRAGTAIARIDPQDYQLGVSAARSQQAAAEVDARQAASDLHRLEDLQKKGFVSDAALEQRKSALSAAQARVEQARAQTGTQSNQVSYTTLLAPDAGIVVGVDAEVGQVVAAGQTIVRVAKQGEKDALVAVPESLIALVKQAGSVEVSSSALPGKQFVGQIREVSPLADPATRTFAVKVAISDPQALQLGMSANVSFTGKNLARQAGSARIPLSALVNLKGKTIVWTLQDGKASAREVKPLAGAGESEIDVLGLKPGEQIVAAGGHLLAAGDAIKAWVAK